MAIRFFVFVEDFKDGGIWRIRDGRIKRMRRIREWEKREWRRIRDLENKRIEEWRIKD